MNPDPLSLSTAAIDDTPQKLAERVAELERLRLLTATMLSALSHDIRTPLTALALNAELLLRRGDETGRRIKSATLMLGRQVDHLVNLASRPGDDLLPQRSAGRLGELVRQRLALPVNQALLQQGAELVIEGDDQAQFDAGLMSEAIDHLLLQAATHAADGALRVSVDGHGRHAVALRLMFDAVLSNAASLHLLGDGSDGVSLEGTAVTRSGSGLSGPERVVRAHGGSLIGRSKEREGTLFEMMLPRGTLV